MSIEIDVDARVKKARDLFTGGYNCAQAVFLAYHDLFKLDTRLAATIAAPLGGGMGRLREVCGAVSAMSLLAGFIEPSIDPFDKETKTRNYALVQAFAEKFRKENGAIVCRELLGLGREKESPEPSDRTQEYYRKRPCVEYIAVAARIVGEEVVSYKL